jgi:putative sterol carrier protein
MDDAIRNFFEGVAGTHPELPKTVSGTLRFDLENGEKLEHWRVTLEKGSVSASRSSDPADCVVATQKTTLEAIIHGRMNAMAALLRGTIHAEGDILLLAVFRALLAAPAASPAIPRERIRAGRPS